MKPHPRTLIVIPARGGSKGIKDKNIRPLGGVSLIAWVCATAQAADEVDHVVVSTDSPAIAAAASAAGVTVPWLRDEALAADDTLVIDVLIDAVERVERSEQVVVERICLLQPTSPFVTPGHVQKALQTAAEQSLNTVVCGYPVGQKHPDIMFTLDDDRNLEWYTNTEHRMARRQDLSELYARGGLFYIVDRNTLMTDRSLYGKHTGAVLCEADICFSIDTPADLLYAQSLLDTGAVSDHPVLKSQETVRPTASGDGSRDTFDENWKRRREAGYIHWTRDEPANQIQLAFRQHWELFSTLLGHKSGAGKKVLEVGCGRGSLSCYFSDAGYDCHLLDSSAAIIDQARSMFEELKLPARFTVGDALDLPFEENTFDVIFSIGLLEHFESIEKPLAEQWRVLKPGGMLLVYVVPEKEVGAQQDVGWVNELLKAFAGTVEKTAQKDEVYRTDYPAQAYLEVMKKWSPAVLEARGAYPLPMISHSPEFPFTLLPPDCEQILVQAFQRILAQRAETAEIHPWLCEESYGQAFLVWAMKEEQTS